MDTHIGKYPVCYVIPINKYQSLLNDNEQLQKEIKLLTNNEMILHNIILDKDKTIYKLREENKKLINSKYKIL